MRELGYDKSLDSAVGKLPDGGARFSHIANLTGRRPEEDPVGPSGGGHTAAGGIRYTSAVRALDRCSPDAPAWMNFRKLAHETATSWETLSQRTGESASLFTDIMLAGTSTT